MITTEGSRNQSSAETSRRAEDFAYALQGRRRFMRYLARRLAAILATILIGVFSTQV